MLIMKRKTGFRSSFLYYLKCKKKIYVSNSITVKRLILLIVQTKIFCSAAKKKKKRKKKKKKKLVFILIVSNKYE